MNPKILASTLAFHPRPPSTVLSWALDIGFDGLEVLCDPPWHPAGWPAGEREALAAARAHLSLHAPVADVSLMSPHPGARRFAENEIAAAVKLAAELGAFSVTFPLGARPTMGAPHAPPWEEAKAAVRRLADKAQGLGVSLSLENDPQLPELYLWDLRLFGDFLAETGLPGVLDVGHAWTAHREEAAAKVAPLVSRLKGVHLHDNHGTDDAHLALGAGSVDVRALWSVLGDVEFVALETGDPAGLQQSLAVLLRLQQAVDLLT